MEVRDKSRFQFKMLGKKAGHWTKIISKYRDIVSVTVTPLVCQELVRQEISTIKLNGIECHLQAPGNKALKEFYFSLHSKSSQPNLFLIMLQVCVLGTTIYIFYKVTQYSKL